MWVDTHNHFDFDVFDGTRAADWSRARSLGVSAQFVMSTIPSHFTRVAKMAELFDSTYFALGIHPLFIDHLDLSAAMKQLETAIFQHRDNPQFIGVGEIGLDGFVKDNNINRQVECFTAQLNLARDFELPVFMHVRKAQDRVLKYCRQFGISKGIAHAFNGSHQQADNYLAQELKLGFGGAFTFAGAKQLQRLIHDLPLEAFVLETDAPDMSPAWARNDTNYSYQLPRIATEMARLRQIDEPALAEQLKINVAAVVDFL